MCIAEKNPRWPPFKIVVVLQINEYSVKSNLVIKFCHKWLHLHTSVTILKKYTKLAKTSSNFGWQPS